MNGVANWEVFQSPQVGDHEDAASQEGGKPPDPLKPSPQESGEVGLSANPSNDCKYTRKRATRGGPFLQHLPQSPNIPFFFPPK